MKLSWFSQPSKKKCVCTAVVCVWERGQVKGRKRERETERQRERESLTVARINRASQLEPFCPAEHDFRMLSNLEYSSCIQSWAYRNSTISSQHSALLHKACLTFRPLQHFLSSLEKSSLDRGRLRRCINNTAEMPTHKFSERDEWVRWR